MRHTFLLLIFAAFWCLNVQAQEADTIAYFDPEQVFVVENDTVQEAFLESCRQVAGNWEYSKPYVHADGSSVLGKLGKPIAKSKLKKGLDKAFKKLKIKSRWNSMALNDDGSWEMRVLGLPLNGSYSYNVTDQTLTLKYKGIPLKSHVHRDGKKLYVAFDTDRLLMVLSVLSGLSHSATLKSLAFLSKNYSNVMVGFEMKLAK